MILTVLYQLTLAVFVALFIWNLLTLKSFYRQAAIVLILIPLILRLLFIR